MFSKKNKNQPRRSPASQESKRAYSYYSNTRLRGEEAASRPRQQSAEKPKKKPARYGFWHHIPSVLALAAILVCFGYILSINPSPRIVQATDKSIYLRDISTYQAAANKIISSSILNYNKVTFDVSGVAKKLKAEFPELSSATISMPLINRRPVIHLTGSQPAMVLISGGSSVVVDVRGIAVLPTSQTKNLAQYKLPTIKDESGLDVSIGKAVLPADSAQFIDETVQQFGAAKTEVDQFSLPAVANQLNVKLNGKKYYIKMDLSGDSREQVGAYLAVVEKLRSLKQEPGQYIDVRLPGRVFYK